MAPVGFLLGFNSAVASNHRIAWILDIVFFQAATALYTYLVMTAGNQVGSTFVLVEDQENSIGRGSACQIVLDDPLCSRVHAVLSKVDDRWCVRDASLNGTHVNDQKIDQAALDDGHRIRVGSTEFSFHHTDLPPTTTSKLDPLQTIIQERPVEFHETSSAVVLDAVRDSEQARDLLLLYQLSINLLGTAEASLVIRNAMELLKEHIGATVVGFLWMDDEGDLRPKFSLPDDETGKIPLSQSLTALVAKQRRAVWVASQQPASATDSVRRFADAMCIPLQKEGVVLGAVHIYLQYEHFTQSQFDFAVSVVNITSVALSRARHEQRLQADLKRLQDQTGGHDTLLGESRAMRELKEKIQRLAPAGGCVLICGESGVGKELVARAVHRASSRAESPLVAVNCAAIPEQLMESQLFGHKAGAFTGAETDHEGYFQQADLGTLFLDEIGEMTLAGQAKLLRILDGHTFQPVGSTQDVRVHVRVVAATNQDLQRFVREKKFREDLYYRLCVFEIDVPPLRDRGDDVGLLLDHFLHHFRAQHGRPCLEFSEEARLKLLEYRWPGNVRQLRNVVDSAVVLAGGDQIQVSDLALRDAGDDHLESLKFDYWERKLIAEALSRTEGAVPEAAKLLGIGRATLYRKIEEYGIRR